MQNYRSKMAFEKLKEQISELQADSEKVLQSNIHYYKLWLFKVLTRTMTDFTKILLLGSVAFLVFLFLAIASAFAIGMYLENNALGFLIVGSILFVVLLLIFIFKKKLVEKPLLSKMSKIYFKE
ncbi:MAG: hypothetical protein KGV44_05515 [Flavobacteriaceae bacterium]|nr:hypothetical protein [Flavobacteriaceae bacterium]